MASKVIAENLHLLDGRELTGRGQNGGNARPAGAGEGRSGSAPMGHHCFCLTP